MTCSLGFVSQIVLHKSVGTSDHLAQVCSIVYLGALFNGNWPSCWQPSGEADRKGSINGANGRHLWDLHLDKVFGKSNLYVCYDSTLMSTYLVHAGTERLHYNNHGHTSFRSHQMQPLHPILPAIPALAMGQNQRVDRSNYFRRLLHCCHSYRICIE